MIKQFRVQNYKALRDVRLDLTPMHVLIGHANAQFWQTDILTTHSANSPAAQTPPASGSPAASPHPAPTA